MSRLFINVLPWDIAMYADVRYLSLQILHLASRDDEKLESLLIKGFQVQRPAWEIDLEAGGDAVNNDVDKSASIQRILDIY